MSDVNLGLARSLVDEWARAGVTTAVLSPGSRSAPLALALAADDRIRLHVFLDERSASFFALGEAKASRRPVIILTTSGTAAANVHPAVLEAHHSRVPLVVCTADRPPELRDTGAGQAIDQIKLYGDAIRWFCEVGVPEDRDGAGAYWRSVAARAVTTAAGPPAGPAHLNLAFREPLIPTGEKPAGVEGRAGGAPWVTSSPRPALASSDEVERLIEAVGRSERGVLVAGWGSDVDSATVQRFVAAVGWPLLADPLSGLRAGDQAISTYDALLRSADFGGRHQPDLVVQLGAPLTNKPAMTWLSAPDHLRILIDPDGAWLDPQRAAGERLTSSATDLFKAVVEKLAGAQVRNEEWLGQWLGAEASARKAIDDLIDGWDQPFEGRVARDVAAGLDDGGALVVGSSMPVRDVESFARPRSGVRILANRGVNGIDGFVSTALGVASGSDAPVVALTGDLAFLYDAGGLLDAARRGLNVTFVVLDNAGGGVFSFLPQAQLPEHFEALFGTPHHVDLVALAEVHGLGARRVTRAGDVMPVVELAIKEGGVQVVVVPTDRADNVRRHQQVWDAVTARV
ncbi:MAG TPA: 2-succinyl-5-enolpyruvyl-6-hydroxy-3-cyclohexene-1-carboxylic-acid synthase [Acidimicrobiales bacterium]|nr:2-succinyl-5-enolpyruvyl-6-hydroxy-3-cyclohexene-1-carboxylic-acid synthase [Acidimicrobiales bacterium]